MREGRRDGSGAPAARVEAVRTALAAALSAAAAGLEGAGDSAGKVHRTRRALKTSAALAQLFTGAAPRETAALLSLVKAARRSLGDVRDLDVFSQTAERLGLDEDVLAAVRTAVGREQRRLASNPAFAPWIRRLHAAEARVRRLRPAVSDDELVEMIASGYGSARKMGANGFAGLNAEDLHDLRKRVVDLSEQLAVWTGRPGEADAFDRLRQILGKHQDFDALLHFVEGRRDLLMHEKGGIAAAAKTRLKVMRKRAAAMHARLFVEPRKVFLKRLRSAPAAAVES